MLKIDPTQRTASIDIRDPAFYQNPYPVYDQLRQACPMFYWEEHDLWTFTTHDDVSSLLKHRSFGRQISHLKSRQEMGLPAEPDSIKPFFDIDRLSMLGMEPPNHTRLRGLVQKAFMTREIERLRPRIEQICDDLIKSMLEKSSTGNDPCDLLTEYATPIPVTVIAELLGVPLEMTAELLRWSHAMIKMYEMERTQEAESNAVAASREFVSYLRSLVDQRRKSPQDDLITRLIEVESKSDRLTENELISNCILLLNAGHEATVNVIGNGILALLNHPDQLQKWRINSPEDREFDRLAVEELVRFDTPLHQFNRWVLTPVEIHGQKFDCGDEVGLLLGSANRDPVAFESPNDLRLNRKRNSHLGFGGGIHYCLGAPLARLELQIAFTALIRKCKRLELVEEPKFQNSFHFHGLESLKAKLA